MTMTPETWIVIGTGVVILIAIAASHHQLRGVLREEMNGLRGELRGGMNGLRGELKEIRVEIAGLRERMAKLEGLLEGLREAISGRKAA